MSDSLNILYVGDLAAGDTGLQRLRALEQLGHKVFPIDFRDYARGKSRILTFWSRLNNKLFRMHLPHFRRIDFTGVNKSILEYVRSEPVDLLWLGKVLTVRAQTLLEVKKVRPRCTILGYSPDDMGGRHNQSSDFLACLPLYDAYFTTKSYGVEELKALGCPRVYFVPNAFDPDTHRPIALNADEKKKIGGEVGFVGNYEEARAESIQFLASRGIPVRIYGQSWKIEPVNGCLRLDPRAVWGQEYAKVICSFDISLCFLRRINRDRQTQRSVEIPACGAFMLAERTDEHRALFEEGVEAEFFASDEELLDKTRYYLAHPEERKRIATAGRDRCLRSGYSYQDRLQWILQKARELQP